MCTQAQHPQVQHFVSHSPFPYVFVRDVSRANFFLFQMCQLPDVRVCEQAVGALLNIAQLPSLRQSMGDCGVLLEMLGMVILHFWLGDSLLIEGLKSSILFFLRSFCRVVWQVLAMRRRGYSKSSPAVCCMHTLPAGRLLCQSLPCGQPKTVDCFAQGNFFWGDKANSHFAC